MSSSFVLESPGSDSKKDDTLIIVVNDDGTISVDQETLQNLIMNQSDANVSVVRVGQSEGDDANGDLTLTVDPPHFERVETTRSTIMSTAVTTDVAALVDPFMEMDPEQLEKLETALQSEQAKQILGENVTAMLDMLTVEEQQKSIKYCIELDHCYTSRTSPTDPEPSDPLPIANSPDIDNFDYKHSALSQQSSALISPSIDANVVDSTSPPLQSPTTPSSQPLLPTSSTPSPTSPSASTPGRLNQHVRKTKKSSIGRGRKIGTSVPQSTSGTPKSTINLRNSTTSVPQSSNKGTSIGRFEAEQENNEASSLSESSISEPPSDDDSDFGPRGPRRGGVRARGGRKGLTTRGGSMTAARRRSSNKQMDVEQVRRLDMEMAAAVDAMKSPEKSERPDKFNLRVKKQPRILGARKKEDVSPSRTTTLATSVAASLPTSSVSASSPPPSSSRDQETLPTVLEKPPQTTNQVKANLISANMIKGDMILTKPGQSRNNQRVVFVKKRVMVRANELRNDLGMQKQSLLVSKSGKTMPVQVQTKLGPTDDQKLVPVGGTTILQNIQPQQQKPKTATIVSTVPTTVTSPQSLIESCTLPVTSAEQRPQQSSPQVENPSCQLPSSQQHEQSIQHCVKIANIESTLPLPPLAIITPPTKVKTPDIKKEKKKSESELSSKLEETSKPVEAKTPVDVTKKHPKKEQRKFPAVFVDALGPALFSTPDIIRRVGAEVKGNDGHGTPTSTAAHVHGTTTTTTALVHGTSTSITPPVHDSTSSATLKSPIKSLDLPSSLDASEKSQGTSLTSMETEILRDIQTSAENEAFVKIPMEDDAILHGGSSNELKTDAVPTLQELEPSLDSAKNPPLTGDTAISLSANVVPNEIPPEQSEIDSDDHLLATLDMGSAKHDVQLLAEALLLQEALGVDLTDHASLVDPTITEPLLSNTTFETPLDSQGPSMETLDSMKSLLHEIAPVTVAATELPKKKDEKEPIQIIRGGRVITLPPIEAPATRSKRLQAKPETLQKLPEYSKKDEKPTRQLIHQQHTSHQRTKSIGDNDASLIEGVNINDNNDEKIQQNHDMEKMIEDDDDDDDDDDDEADENSDSEDDPDRLWCICKRPHNNRFMICCDVCEDWFHGKCVHVSKAMGQQMEEKGIEWVCPNCVKKKDPNHQRQKKPQVNPVKSLKVESAPRSVEERAPQLPSPRTVLSMSEKGKTPEVFPTSSFHDSVPPLNVTQCVVCKKEARNSSIYCSDACILTHAQETLTKENKPAIMTQTKIGAGTSDVHKPSADARVIVFEKRTGKVLTGADAPTTSNLKTWLKENPTFEVLRPNNLNTLQIGGKTVTAIQTHGMGKLVKTVQGTSSGGQPKMIYTKVVGSKQTVLAPSNKKLVVLSGGQQQQQRASLSPKTIQQKSQQVSVLTGKSPVMRQTTIKMVSQQAKASPTLQPKQATVKKQETAKAQSSPQQPQKSVMKSLSNKRAEAEPIRLNVRKTLAEQLTTRIKDSEDLRLRDNEINELALNIELELYKYFRDTGAKYKAKYRSLVFNIKDTKNLTLFRKIADRSLTPDAVVRLSPEEMASQELAEWREKETKHQLEMIKKNELDLMSQAKSIVVKTHKGEVIIENEGGTDHVDPKTSVQDIVMALNSQDDPPSEDIKDESSRGGGVGGNSSASEDAKRPSQSIITSVEVKKKLEKEKSSDRGTRSIDKEDKLTRIKSTDDEDERRRRRKRKRSHSRGRSRHSKDRERSRDRKSTRSKESKRDKDSKDREKSEKESRQRGGKDRQKRSRGSKSRDHRNKGKDEESGRGSRREDSERKNDGTMNQTGSGVGGDVEKPIEDRLWRHVEDESATATNVIFDGNDSDVSDREPSSTVNIKTPDINDDPERYKDTIDIGNVTEDSTAASTTAIVQDSEQQDTQKQSFVKSGPCQTVWRGFVNMVDVAKFFINAQEVSGHAKDLMEDLPDTVDVVGRISHETVWDYISKMKKTGSKEILIIRLTAANDEEKIPYITLYSYLNSRSRLGVVGNVSKNIKDFYIMPFSRQSQLPAVLLPLVGPGFEEQRPHLLLGIIVRNKRKRVSSSVVASVPSKILKKDDGDSSKEKNHGTSRHHTHHHHHHHHSQQPLQQESSVPDSPRTTHKGLLLESLREKQTVTQMTLESLNKAQVGMSRGGATMIDNTAISKLVPELSSKLDLNDSPKAETPMEKLADGTTSDEIECDDGDEPYSPGGATDVDEPDEPETRPVKSDIDVVALSASSSNIVVPTKNSNELQRKMDELNRQIEEQKQQIQTISSSFLGDATTTLPGLGLDPPEVTDMEEAYSPTDARSFTPPPPGMAKFAQPILDKVSDITIPANLQEILANVKRQESSKVDPYLPSKPSATFLTSANPSVYPTKTDKYTPTFIGKINNPAVRVASTGVTLEKPIFENSPSSLSMKETKSTLRSLSDLDLIKKAEEELAAVAAAEASSPLPPPPQPEVQCSPVVAPCLSFSSPPPPTLPPPLPPSVIGSPVFKGVQDAALENISYPPPSITDSENKKISAGSFTMDQPKPPGLEDEDLPVFPATAPTSVDKTISQKFVPKSGVVVSVKRKVSEDGATSTTAVKTPRTKSRWGQGPTE